MIWGHLTLNALFVSVFLVGLGGAQEENPAAREEFEAKYDAWKNHLVSRPASRSRTDYAGTVSPPYKEIAQLRANVLPYLMDKYEQDGDLHGAVVRVTGRQFADQEKQAFGGDDYALYLHWWKNERQRTGEEFWEKYCKWRHWQEGDSIERPYEPHPHLDAGILNNMGVIAIPWVVRGIEAGDSQLIYVLSSIMRRQPGGPAVPENATREQCLEWWEKNKGDWWWVPEESVKWPPVPVTDHDFRKDDNAQAVDDE